MATTKANASIATGTDVPTLSVPGDPLVAHHPGEAEHRRGRRVVADAEGVEEQGHGAEAELERRRRAVRMSAGGAAPPGVDEHGDDDGDAEQQQGNGRQHERAYLALRGRGRKPEEIGSAAGPGLLHSPN